MSWLLETFIEIFRWLLWLITCIMYSIADLIYNVVHEIAAFDFINQVPQVWTYYEWFMTAFLVFFIIFRLSKRYLKIVVDEQEAQQIDPLNIILKIAAIGFLIIFLPKILSIFGELVSKLVDNIAITFTGKTDGSFSDLILEALEPKINGMVKSGKVKSLYDVDINAGGYGNYEVCNDWATFICLLGGSIFGSYILLLIGIQIGGRFLSMAMKLILAPYSISSLVDEKNDSFTTWWKLFLADFLANYMQILLLVIGSTLFLNIPLNGFAKIIAYIGALMGILNAPSGVSQLIGADIGVTSALQSMQTTMMGLGMAKSLGSVVGGVAKTAGALTLNGGGRLFGGTSRKMQQATGTKGGFDFSGAMSPGYNQDDTGSGLGAGVLTEREGQLGSTVGTGGGLLGDIKSGKLNKDSSLGDVVDSFKNGGVVNLASKAQNLSSNLGSVGSNLSQIKLSNGFVNNAMYAGKAALAGVTGKFNSTMNKGFTKAQDRLSGSQGKPSGGGIDLMKMASQPIVNNPDINNINGAGY